MTKIASMPTNFEPIDGLAPPSGVVAGFFVSRTPVDNKAGFLQAEWMRAGFKPKKPLYLKQVHSGTVLHFLGGATPNQPPVGDAIVTDSKEVFLVIQVADCLPVLFYDPVGRLVAGAHAGWKGSLLGIVPQVVRRLVGLGSRPECLKVWIGPSIRSCCYEVDVERSVLFPQRVGSARHIDLLSFNSRLLELCRVRKESIFKDQRCTACSPEKLPSYRRDGRKSGRIFACIALA